VALTGWKYRRSHKITLASGSATNYTHPIIVKRTTGTATGNVVYVGDKCKTDFADIRFTDAELTELDYFISKTTEETAIFWILIPSLSSGDNTIYVYYGNEDATSNSSAEDVFPLFFDTFASFDSDAWDYEGSVAPDCSDSRMAITSDCGIVTTKTAYNVGCVEFIALVSMGYDVAIGFRLTSDTDMGGKFIWI